MKQGWILDAIADYTHNTIFLWIKDETGATTRLQDTYQPSIYVYSTSDNLKNLIHHYQGYKGIDTFTYEKKKLWLGTPEKKVLKITLTRYQLVRELSQDINEYGGFSQYELFNSDVNIPLMYMIEKGLSPLTKGKLAHRFILQENPQAIDYEKPKIREVILNAETRGVKQNPAWDNILKKVWINDLLIMGSEEDILRETLHEIHRINPDVIYTDGGDSFLFPYLYHRAHINDIPAFYFGREKDMVSQRKERSYFSYGRTIYRPPSCMINGRIHIDRASSFLYNATGLPGLIELSRLSRIPLQQLSRLTPGTVITAIQMDYALRENVLIKWKKNVPESFKDAGTLFHADRGGMIYDPQVGFHEKVIEIDFTSLYPSIMVLHNISPETLLCTCCTGGKHRVPFIGYHVCEKNRGFLPRVVQPLIERRIEYKNRIKKETKTELINEYTARKKALKWILVTCFGYTGYRNACFGRIECHEAITAYGREILVKTAEIAQDNNYRVLHGIVDSLWLQGSGNPGDVCKKIQEVIHIPIEVEGIYRWIVFLPRRGQTTGALNRYYGCLENGDIKLRGIEMRQGNVPPLVKAMQGEMLTVLSQAKDIQELRKLVPRTIAIAKRYIEKIREGTCRKKDLVFTSRVSRPVGTYRHHTNNVACLLQLQDDGIMIKPGQYVQYIITDATAKKYQSKVTAWKESWKNRENEYRYDKETYIKCLLRGGESLLLPFGYTQKKLQDSIESMRQAKLPV